MVIEENKLTEDHQQSPSPRPNRAISGAVRVSDWTLSDIDPDGLRYVTRAWVWIHWSVCAVSLIVLVYRPAFEIPRYYVVYSPLFLLLVVYVGFIHYRLAIGKDITWHWILGFCGMDVALLTSCVVAGGGFSHYFFHLLFYPVLAGVALTFTSFGLNIVWVTVISAAYLTISLTVGEGIELSEREEKPLFVRIAVMYLITVSVNLVSRFERIRWREAVERERALRHERTELSRAIHDTTAQTAYMIGLGIHRARELADESNEELIAALDGTAALSRSAMWELRLSIDSGQIFEGRELGRVLRSHCTSFERITGVPTQMVQSGTDPGLAPETSSRLFTIAHNALTNALLHAGPGRVVARLAFKPGSIRLSVSDDGVGLPDDYPERGRGFHSMRAEAERMGGVLIVESGEGRVGTTVLCVVPDETERGGG